MSKGWYPIINEETCVECGKCVEKCSHGVFNKESAEKPVVIFNEGCIDKCHGCGGLCPTGSITYANDDTGWTPPNTKKETSNKSNPPNENKGLKTMRKMQIYEPAMCCATGICGPSIDPELLRISTSISALEKVGIKVDRYNLSNFPQEFVKNIEINKRLTDEGVEVLPIVVVDGKIVITKRYPSNDEFIKLLEIPDWHLEKSEKPEKDSSCCSGREGCC